MNREKIVKNSTREPEVLNELKNWELRIINVFDTLMMTEVNDRIFFKRRLLEAEAEAAKKRPHVTYYHFNIFPNEESKQAMLNYFESRNKMKIMDNDKPQSLISEKKIESNNNMADIQVRDNSSSV